MKCLKYCFSFILIVLIESKTLPKYITKCSLKNPEEFSKCAVAKGNQAIQKLNHGDKEYKIPDLDPLKISSLDLNTPGLKLSIFNVTVLGIKDTKVISIKYEPTTNNFYMHTVCPKVSIVGHFKIDGKILVLPLSGEGDGKITFLHGEYNYTFPFKPVKKHGKDVIKVENQQLLTKFGGATFEIANFFNGNDQIASEINRFLNENWTEVVKEFDSLIRTPIQEVVYSVFSGILDNLTYDEVFEDI